MSSGFSKRASAALRESLVNVPLLPSSPGTVDSTRIYGVKWCRPPQLTVEVKHFDLTASTHHGALSAMLRLMPVSQLLLGFDFPFMPPATVAPAIASLESFEGLSSDDQRAIASGNARRLLPKVGAR